MHVYVDNINIKDEDTHFHFHIEHYLVTGVADGHGGKDASTFCKNNINKVLKSELKNDTDMNRTLQKTFEILHDKCLLFSNFSGTTLTVVVIDLKNKKYTCANVGDSHALHVKKTSFMWITTSHRLQDNSNERTRLKSYISYARGLDNYEYGPPRIYPGGLAMSRSIGDADCKQSSCQPDIYEDFLDNEDTIVICTDGIWDFVNVNKLIKVVRNNYNPEFLCRMAVKNNTRDDATAMIVTTQNIKTSIHKNLFNFFSRNGSTSSLSSSEEETSPVMIKVNVN